MSTIRYSGDFIIESDDFPPMSVRKFLRVNRLDAQEAREILSLKPGETYEGGGGSQPQWGVTRQPVDQLETQRRTRERESGPVRKGRSLGQVPPSGFWFWTFSGDELSGRFDSIRELKKAWAAAGYPGHRRGVWATESSRAGDTRRTVTLVVDDDRHLHGAESDDSSGSGPWTAWVSQPAWARWPSDYWWAPTRYSGPTPESVLKRYVGRRGITYQIDAEKRRVLIYDYPHKIGKTTGDQPPVR